MHLFRTALFSAIFLSTELLGHPVSINSGNPAFPFPQFLPYVHSADTLQNLATHNAPGVVHAEMEKSTREAYQIMMNRADYTGMVLGGIKYILFASVPSCTEGTGYAMLAAAMMADKTTFDGLWLNTHDFAMNNVIRYLDGKASSPGYQYSTLAGFLNASGGNSATDGDDDIAMGLMIAYKQWGEFMGINDSRGQPISYKHDLIEFLKGYTDTIPFVASNGKDYLSGDIGLDGYFKGGDTWAELTSWANDITRSHYNKIPTFGSATAQHIDYAAPGYYYEFSRFLASENPGTYAWNIGQFDRAEASSDWLIGKMYQQDERNIPCAGWVSLNDDAIPTFSQFNDGEDFRCGWRTIINYMWHGNGSSSWDPVKHSVIPGATNSFERDMALRYSKFLWDGRQAPWNNGCVVGNSGFYWGTAVLNYYNSLKGVPMGAFYLNWPHGTGAPSAVASQDFDLMAEMYRYCEIEWDIEKAGDRYMTSVPRYFHEFFRVLGMCILSGNHHAPSKIISSANMKVYVDVNRTYAFEGDSIVYSIDYRNYGSADANQVLITDKLHNDFVFLSCTGGGTYDPSSNTVKWNIASVPGFKTATGIVPTTGHVTLSITIPKANEKRYQNPVQISCSNGFGWTSNEYPNRVSPVMKRNGVDIARRSLLIKRTVSPERVNPGMTVTFTTSFENSSEAGWLNGGRPGIHFSYSHAGTDSTDNVHKVIIKMFNDAAEPYIDYGNYRFSYFLYDAGRVGLEGAPGITNGWHINPINLDGLEPARIKLVHEKIPQGMDAHGKWNQRLVLQFSDPTDPTRPDTNWATMATITRFLELQYGNLNRIHRGQTVPLRTVWDIQATGGIQVFWGDDWSFNPRTKATPQERGYPVTPDFTDPNPSNPGVPVTTWNPKYCDKANYSVDNVLIEEWDGYTWRRVFGNGPLPGRDVNDVTVRDTLPKGLTFGKFTGESPLGIAPVINGNVITWSTPKMQVGEKGVITYTAVVDTPPSRIEKKIITRSWISSPKESPVSDEAIVIVSFDPVPPEPPKPTSMHKSSNKAHYYAGDTIAYQISYRQTQGTLIANPPADQWISASGNGKLSIDSSGTITYNVRSTKMFHQYSYGVNGTIGGTITPVMLGLFSIMARYNGSSFVEIRIKQEVADLTVTFFNGKTQVGVLQHAVYPEFPKAFNFKLQFNADTVRFWAGDTTASFPAVTQTGIAANAGYAGLFSTNDLGMKISGWNTHFDAGYDIFIRDTIPWGIRFLDGSGKILAGSLAGASLTPMLDGKVIKWPIVSDTVPFLANDSAVVSWRGIVDTSKGPEIVNTAFAHIMGYPADSIGAQANAKFGKDTIPEPPHPPIDTTKISVTIEPKGVIFNPQIKVKITASVPGASIWYTTNGQKPDSSLPGSKKYISELLFSSTATLTATAYAPGFLPADPVTEKYEKLKTAPVSRALSFDSNGDGVADGIALIVQSLSVAPNFAVIGKHTELISLPGSAAIRSLENQGDTIIITSSDLGAVSGSQSLITIREPGLPDNNYENKHGYLSGSSISVEDGIAPVIIRAQYKPFIKGASPAEGGSGDTLLVTFSKWSKVLSGPVSEVFHVDYRGGSYTFFVWFLKRAGINEIEFIVDKIGGSNPVIMPSKGDSVRIIPGNIADINGIVQQNPKNHAVALEIEYRDMKLTLKVVPNPFQRGGYINIIIQPTTIIPYQMKSITPRISIVDCVGNTVLPETPVPLNESGSFFIYKWNGTNRNNRIVGAGAYLAFIIVKNGNETTVLKKTIGLR